LIKFNVSEQMNTILIKMKLKWELYAHTRHKKGNLIF